MLSVKFRPFLVLYTPTVQLKSQNAYKAKAKYYTVSNITLAFLMKNSLDQEKIKVDLLVETCEEPTLTCE
jgi:hypothetical protein